MKLFLIGTSSFIFQRQLRNKQIGILTRIAVALQTIALFILVVGICLKLNSDFLLSLISAQAIWQQFVIESLHLKLNRYNYLEEQEEIRKRFGLITSKKKSTSSLWYYRRILIFPATVTLLLVLTYTDLNLYSLQITFISLHLLLQIHQGSVIFVDGVKQHNEQYKDYYNDVEGEGLISRNNLMLRRSELRTQTFKDFLKICKKVYQKILLLYFILCLGYEIFSILTKNSIPFDLLNFISKQTNIEVSNYLLILCQLHILFIVLYIGNNVMQKKINRVKRLYEHVKKEQEKLSIEGSKFLSGMVYLSLLLIIFFYYENMQQEIINKLINIRLNQFGLIAILINTIRIYFEKIHKSYQY